MPKANTKENFIEKARLKHGNKYDYSKVIYANNKTPVEIICPKHGAFWQRPDSHLHGKGCMFCALDNQKTLLFGVGINDIYLSQNTPLYYTWKDMLERCYKKDKRHNAYKDCYVCDEWLTLSKFREFFDLNYIDGFCLDKDYLYPGNKVYSPDTCIFIPKEINSLLVRCGRDENGKLHGVNYNKKLKKYVANVSNSGNGKRIHIGVYTTMQEAENAYIHKKKEIIKNIADKYKDIMPTKTYNVIINHNF